MDPPPRPALLSVRWTRPMTFQPTHWMEHLSMPLASQPRHRGGRFGDPRTVLPESTNGSPETLSRSKSIRENTNQSDRDTHHHGGRRNRLDCTVRQSKAVPPGET